MASRTSPRLLALPPGPVAEASRVTVADACDYFDPDAVWLLATERAPRAHATVRSVTDGPVIHTSLGDEDGPHHERPGDGEAGARVDVVGVRDPAELPTVGRALRDGEFGNGVGTDESDTVFVGCPVVVAVDETRLSATLPAADDLAALVDRAPCRVVVLSDALPAPGGCTGRAGRPPPAARGAPRPRARSGPVPAAVPAR